MITQTKLENPSVHGLKTDCLSFGEVLAQSFAVIAPTTIPASNLGLLVALSGNGTWLSFVIGIIGLVFVSLNINQFARRSASPGSLYSYIVEGLGPTAGVICGWSLVLAYLFTGMSTLCGFANFSSVFIGYLGIHPSSITLLAIGAGIAWYAAYKDIQLSAIAMLWMEGISLTLIAILCLIIWAHHGFAFDMAQLTLKDTKPSNVIMGLVLVMFAFSGFESATSLGDEAKNPLKSIPRSVLGSVLLAGVFFIATTFIEVMAFQGTGVSITTTDEPLGFLANQIGLGFLGQLIAVGALASFFTCVLGCINPAARIFFLMARHGLFSSLGVCFMMLPILGSLGVPGNSLFPVPPAPYNVFPYLFLMYLAVTCGWFFWQRFRSPHVVRSMKQGIAAINARFDESDAQYHYPQSKSVD